MNIVLFQKGSTNTPISSDEVSIEREVLEQPLQPFDMQEQNLQETTFR